MGGYGSGTWSRWSTRPKAESYLSICVFKMHRWGYLSQYVSSFQLSWSQHGERIASISGFGGRNSIRLVYTSTSNSGEKQDRNYEIQIEWTPCNYGGERPWFFCPNCLKRVAKLYAGQKFLCRICRGCVYRSQSGDFLSRAIGKRERLEAKLYHHSNGLMYRPKGMHWKTFDRINTTLDAYEYGVDQRFEQAITKLSNRGKQK